MPPIGGGPWSSLSDEDEEDFVGGVGVLEFSESVVFLSESVLFGSAIAGSEW